VIFFDIETATLPEAELFPMMPEFAPPGNYKDPEKIKANLEEQKTRWMADGALSAVTGRVVCIGLLADNTYMCLHEEDEGALLRRWWRMYSEMLEGIAGHCVKTFDLPFLIRRSWKHGIKRPDSLFNGSRFSAKIQDTCEIWQCGSRDPRDRISLDMLARYLGVGEKTMCGKDFAALWLSDQNAALQYLNNDLGLVEKVYGRLV
jgi:DNA polymerase elongation subunit (family B)